MTAVRFERRGDTYAVYFAYDPAVVDLLKLEVPSSVRFWNPTRREWLIYERVYADHLAEVLGGFGYTVIGIETSRRREVPDAAAWAKSVFKRVGPSRAPLAYKLLSRVCHPDHGGDHQLQSELNQAYAELPNQRRTA